MMKFLNKINPKTKKTIIFVITVFTLFICLQLYSNVKQGKQTETTEIVSSSDETAENEDTDEVTVKKYTFDDFIKSINIGYSNILIFAVLIIVLAVIKNKEKHDLETKKKKIRFMRRIMNNERFSNRRKT